MVKMTDKEREETNDDYTRVGKVVEGRHDVEGLTKRESDKRWRKRGSILAEKGRGKKKKKEKSTSEYMEVV